MEIAPQDVKRRLDAGEKLRLIDVREPQEFALARIEGRRIDSDALGSGKLQSLEEGSLIVYCHHGVRSLNVVNWLRNQGVEDCQSEVGGIDAWSLIVDPAVPRY